MIITEYSISQIPFEFIIDNMPAGQLEQIELKYSVKKTVDKNPHLPKSDVIRNLADAGICQKYKSVSTLRKLYYE